MNRCVAVFVMILLLALPARAIETEVWDSVDTDSLQRQAEDYLDVELTPDIDLDAGLSELGATALEQFNSILVRATRSGGLILMIALFCSLAETVCEGAGQSNKTLPRLVGTLALTAVAVGDLNSLLGLGRDTVVRLSEFDKILIPAITTAAVAGGSFTGAAARQMVTLFCSNLLLHFMEGVLIPMTYLYVAASAGALATENQGMRAIADFVSWGIQTVLKWLLLLFTGYVSISGVIGGTADRAAVKLTRFAISGMVPVVGGILSDATESVLAGAGILRNAIGIFGTLAVMAFCLTPFLHLGIQYLLYKLAAVLTAAVTNGSVSKLIDDISKAFGLILGMTGTAALLTLISIITTVSVAVT